MRHEMKTGARMHQKIVREQHNMVSIPYVGGHS